MEAMKKQEKTYHKVNIDDAVLANSYNQLHKRAESVNNHTEDKHYHANEESLIPEF